MVERVWWYVCYKQSYERFSLSFVGIFVEEWKNIVYNFLNNKDNYSMLGTQMWNLILKRIVER